ncbi:MAG: PQQ-binding-like beta-propeller repeat protein [Nocardioidaceae bacterium]
MRGLLVILVAPLLLASSCGSTTPAQSTSTSTSKTTTTTTTVNTTLANWPTYHRTAGRSGQVATSPRGPLRLGWRRHLAGAVYGEPLVVGHTLIVATERNYVYGLDARTGRELWRDHLGLPQRQNGLPCGNIFPLGITGTPAYDRRTGSVFVARERNGGQHALFALDAATGAIRWRRNLDTQVHRNRFAEQQRSALLVVDNRVITTFGGLAGDCANYVGYATSVATNGKGRVHSYAVPTAREGGMWATPGPVRGTNGNVYVASGNGAERRGRWDRSDSVAELSPVTLRRLSIFAPATWRRDNAQDLDLGSMSPVVVPAVDRMVIAGKRGVVYLLNPALGGVGSALRSMPGCVAFGGAAVAGRLVLMPCKGQTSIRALIVGRSSLRWSWTRKGAYSSPVIAGRRVYVADQSSGYLKVLRLSDGAVLQSLPVGHLPHFSSQIVSGDWVFVPSLGGVTAFRGQ